MTTFPLLYLSLTWRANLDIQPLPHSTFQNTSRYLCYQIHYQSPKSLRLSNKILTLPLLERKHPLLFIHGSAWDYILSDLRLRTESAHKLKLDNAPAERAESLNGIRVALLRGA
jgi:hypothetical protein